MPQITPIHIRRDTAANWSTTGLTTNGTTGNPILDAGELGVESDTGRLKVGNGTSTWNQILYYISPTNSPLGGAIPLAGGTMSGALNSAPIITIASATAPAATAIGAALANTITISGTTAITGFDTIATGAERRLIFSGILTLTYNATSLILPGAASITTAVGDSANFLSLGSGNWQCLSYTRASGSAVVNSAQIALTSVNNWSLTQTSTEMAVAYAATVTLDAASVSNHINIGVLTGNIVLANPTSFTNAVLLNIWLTQDATGSRTLSLGSNIKTAGGAGILLSTAANAVDFLTLSYNPTKGIWVAVIAKGVA